MKKPKPNEIWIINDGRDKYPARVISLISLYDRIHKNDNKYTNLTYLCLDLGNHVYSRYVLKNFVKCLISSENDSIVENQIELIHFVLNGKIKFYDVEKYLDKNILEKYSTSIALNKLGF